MMAETISKAQAKAEAEAKAASSATQVTSKPTLDTLDKGKIVAYTDPKTKKVTYYTKDSNGNLRASTSATAVAKHSDYYNKLASSSAGKAALKAKTITTKPTSKDVNRGEVVAYKDARGIVTYYTKDYNGKLVGSRNFTDVTSYVNKYYTTTEKKQVGDLKDAQSREIKELTQTLQRAGYNKNQIKAIVDSELAQNKAELDRLNQLFASDGVQYAKRDSSGNFIAKVDREGNPINSFERFSSELAYDDPKLAPIAKKNIDAANNFVNQFNRQFNITGDAYKSGKTKIGMDEQAVYNAFDKGYLKYNPETDNYYLDNTKSIPDYSKVDKKFITELAKVTGTSPSYLGFSTTTGQTTTPAKYATANLELNPEGITYTTPAVKAQGKVAGQAAQTYTISADEIKNTWAYNPDDGLYYPPGTEFTQQTLDIGALLIGVGGKGFQRQLTDILSRGTVVGDKAYTKTANNKTYITNFNGKTIGGALVDTGETDWNGNKIYSHTAKHDTKYNKVTTQSLYMQDKDTGDIIYLGTPGMGYLHIKKKSGGLFGGGFGGMVGSLLGGLALSAVLGPGGFGLSTGLANVASSAVMSAINGGDFGDILKSSLTTAIAGGLQDKFSSGNMDVSTTTGAINSVADDLASSFKNVIGDISVADSQAINNIAKNLVTNAISSGGDITKAVEMTIGNATASVVGNQVLQSTNDSNLANSIANTIKTAVSSGDVQTGLGAGLGTYTAGQVAGATGSNVAGALAGTAAGTIASGGDLENALINAGIGLTGGAINSAINSSLNTASSIGTADLDPTSVTGYSVNGTPTTMAGVPVDEFGKELPSLTKTDTTIPSQLISAGTQIASNLINQPDMTGMPTPVTPTGATLAPTTGTAAPGTSVIGGLPTSNVPTKVDVSTLTPVSGGLPTTTPTTPTTTPATQVAPTGSVSPPSKTDVSTLTPYAGTLPFGLSQQITGSQDTSVPEKVNVSQLTPVSIDELPPELKSKVTQPLGGLSQATII